MAGKEKKDMASEAKRQALMGLKSKMSSMGGDSLFDALDKSKGKGALKASVVAKDKKGLAKGLKMASEMMGKYEDGGIVESVESNESEVYEQEDNLEDMSREELLEMLRNQ